MQRNRCKNESLPSWASSANAANSANTANTAAVFRGQTTRLKWMQDNPKIRSDRILTFGEEHA